MRTAFILDRVLGLLIFKTAKSPQERPRSGSSHGGGGGEKRPRSRRRPRSLNHTLTAPIFLEPFKAPTPPCAAEASTRGRTPACQPEPRTATDAFLQQRENCSCSGSKRRGRPWPEPARASASHLPTALAARAASLTARLERVLAGTAGSCAGRAPPRPHRGRHVTAAKSRGKVTASPAPGLARPRRSDPVPPARLGDLPERAGAHRRRCHPFAPATRSASPWEGRALRGQPRGPGRA